MTVPASSRTYTIKEAAALTGLPASTLRYYESVGVVAPVARGASSGHRVYDEEDVDQLMWVACLAATRLSVADMRAYVENGRRGAAAAVEQVELLTAQAARLEVEAAQLVVRQRYVELKVDYWRAVGTGDDARAARLGEEARILADELKQIAAR